MSDDIQLVIKTIQHERNRGIVTCHIVQRLDNEDLPGDDQLDTFVRQLGFSPMRPWKAIHRGQAKAVAQTVLHQDL
jgi:hypothetical protein